MNARRIIVLIAATGLVSCYSGLESGSGGGGPLADDGGQSGAPGSAEGGGEEGGDDGGGDDGTPNDTGDPGDAPFELPAEEVKLLPFHVRVQNLVTIVGESEDHFVFDELRRQRYLLGDHDFANGIAPDLAWNATKMQMWVKAMIPICDSTQFKARYPDLVADPLPLLQQTYGRDPTAEELAGLDDLASGGLDADTHYRLLCVTMLSSLEFVAS